jgi:hypothetical protein
MGGCSPAHRNHIFITRFPQAAETLQMSRLLLF